MKFIAGMTLGDLIEAAQEGVERGERDTPAALTTRLDHFLKVCDAVSYAHSKGVIHRDLKPANVMIGPHREVYVMDWGICRLFGQEEPTLSINPGSPDTLSDDTGGNQTAYGTVIGTPRYMSPEQAQGDSASLGPHSDQCALGLILYELVCLRAPYAGSNVHAVLEAAAHGRRLPALDPHGRQISAPLRAIIDRATAFAPSQRYADVEALAQDVRRYLRGDAVLAMPDTLWQQAQRYVGRHRQQMLISLFGLIAVAALGTILLLQQHEREVEAAQMRESRISHLVESTVRQGDELQLRLLRLEGELDALASAATQLLLHGTPGAEVVRWAEHYADPALRPADFGPQPGYAQPVSLTYGVWTHPQGVERDQVQDDAQRLVNLLPYRNQLFAHARRTLGATRGNAGIDRMVLVLESGLAMVYPGRMLAASAEDHRQSDLYRAAQAAPAAIWGEPYRSSVDRAWLMPLGEALRDGDGQVLGVLWIDVSIEHIVRNLFAQPSDQDAVQLLDREGHVLASQRLLRAVGDTAHASAGRPLFDDPALLAAIRVSDVGAVESSIDGSEQIIAFDRIHPHGWVLINRRAAQGEVASGAP